MEANEVPVGCVVVRNDRVILRTHNLTNQNSDPLSHAEFLAVKSLLAEKAQAFGAYASTPDSADGNGTGQLLFYITVEPCVMCHGVLKRLDAAVFFGCYNEIFGTKKLTGEQAGACLHDPRCVEILKRFYLRENMEAPAEKRISKSNRK